MLISHILKSKGDMVFTIGPDAPLSEACALLNARRVGALVVQEGAGPVLGIISERDLVRVLAGDADGLSRLVGECMTPDVVFAELTETVDALLARMTDRRVRHLPVCRDDKVVGLVSIGDLVKHKIAETEAEAAGLKAYISAG